MSSTWRCGYGGVLRHCRRLKERSNVLQAKAILIVSAAIQNLIKSYHLRDKIGFMFSLHLGTSKLFVTIPFMNSMASGVARVVC